MNTATVDAALFRSLDLTAHLDNTARTTREDLAAGGFNIWRNTFPADELPPAGGRVEVGGVQFAFPADGPDNLRCTGQLIEVPPGRYDWIWVLAAAERRTEDQVLLHFAGGEVDPEWLRVSDFWPDAAPHFGETAAFRCAVLHYPRHVQANMPVTIWRQRVAVPRAAELVAVRLPDNPAIHLFAATLTTADERWNR
jgi:hypothetical protein